MMPEHRLVIGREEILRPPPRPVALDHRVDGDVADSQLFHCCPLISNTVIPGHAPWRGPGIHNPQSWLWIPGSPAQGRVRPGMTKNSGHKQDRHPEERA